MTSPPPLNPPDPTYVGQPYVRPVPMGLPVSPGGQTALICRLCGAQPAVDVTVRAHRGLLFLMTFHRFEGPLCRRCGTAVVRRLTTLTLWQGWWSPFSLVVFTPCTLIWNAVVSRKLTALPWPGLPAPGAVRISEGKPVYRRPLAYVAVLPFVWAVWFITGIFIYT
ncbi:hypothetical protein ACIQVR_27265 [Streptomyces xanthochromogenes]|uniref:hypothetical protein n=1 Tax=Streptomyces xanthochromogenes TaxID=67384 RepID=UPI003804BC70